VTDVTTIPPVKAEKPKTTIPPVKAEKVDGPESSARNTPAFNLSDHASNITGVTIDPERYAAMVRHIAEIEADNRSLRALNADTGRDRDAARKELAQLTQIDPADRIELTPEEATGWTILLRSAKAQRFQGLGSREAASQDAVLARLCKVVVIPS
jgi:hypothetical protein